jgi:hypothetical protein
MLTPLECRLVQMGGQLAEQGDAVFLRQRQDRVGLLLCQLASSPPARRPAPRSTPAR